MLCSTLFITTCLQLSYTHILPTLVHTTDHVLFLLVHRIDLPNVVSPNGLLHYTHILSNLESTSGETPHTLKMASAPVPTITSAPPQVDKRHFFECGDLTLSWEQEWYTAPFFLSSRSSYDRAASRGAAQPPLDIYRTVAACQSELGITVESTITTTTNGDGVAIWTTETRVSTTRSELITATPTTTSSSSTASTSSSSSTSRTGVSTTSASNQSTSSTSTSMSSSISISTSSYTWTPDPSAFPSPLALTSVNTCAGDWDWQAWGVVVNLGFGLIVGLLLWATWTILRGRMPGFYSPRTWSVPQE